MCGDFFFFMRNGEIIFNYIVNVNWEREFCIIVLREYSYFLMCYIRLFVLLKEEGNVFYGRFVGRLGYISRINFI